MLTDDGSRSLNWAHRFAALWFALTLTFVALRTTITDKANDNVFSMPLNSLGDFFAGLVAPPILVYIVVSSIIQARELDSAVKQFEESAKSLRDSSLLERMRFEYGPGKPGPELVASGNLSATDDLEYLRVLIESRDSIPIFFILPKTLLVWGNNRHHSETDINTTQTTARISTSDPIYDGVPRGLYSDIDSIGPIAVAKTISGCFEIVFDNPFPNYQPGYNHELSFHLTAVDAAERRHLAHVQLTIPRDCRHVDVTRSDIQLTLAPLFRSE
ncbi:MAG: hypothetical protein AAF532_16185 [Planctomycetota bacterium]